MDSIESISTALTSRLNERLQNSSSDAESTCSICLSAISAEKYTSECGHSFHVNCIMNWYRTGHETCPNCRSDKYDRIMKCEARDRASYLRKQARKRTAPVRLKKAVLKIRRKEKRKKDTWQRLNLFRKSQRENLKKLKRLNEKYWRACDSLDKDICTLGSMEFPGLIVPAVICVPSELFTDAD